MSHVSRLAFMIIFCTDYHLRVASRIPVWVFGCLPFVRMSGPLQLSNHQMNFYFSGVADAEQFSIWDVIKALIACRQCKWNQSSLQYVSSIRSKLHSCATTVSITALYSATLVSVHMLWLSPSCLDTSNLKEEPALVRQASMSRCLRSENSAKTAKSVINTESSATDVNDCSGNTLKISNSLEITVHISYIC